MFPRVRVGKDGRPNRVQPGKNGSHRYPGQTRRGEDSDSSRVISKRQSIYSSSVVCAFLGAIRGHYVFRSILFNSLEGRGAPQNSFVFNKLVDSNPIGSTKQLAAHRRDYHPDWISCSRLSLRSSSRSTFRSTSSLIWPSSRNCTAVSLSARNSSRETST